MGEKRVIKVDEDWSRQQEEVARQEQLAYERYRERINNLDFDNKGLKKPPQTKNEYEAQQSYIYQKIAEAKEQQRNKYKKSKRAEIKATIKEKVLGLCKATAVVALSATGLATVYLGGQYISAASGGYLDFEEANYVANPNIEAGYYNEKPLVVAISDQFTDNKKEMIIEALEYLDEVCEGIKFEHKLDDGTKDYDVIVNEEDVSWFNTTDTSKTLGVASLNSITQKRRLNGYVKLSPTLEIFRFKSVFIHEMLHVLGIPHSKNIFSLMYPFETRLNLAQQDIDHINAVYPAEKTQESAVYYADENQEQQVEQEEDMVYALMDQQTATKLKTALEEKLNSTTDPIEKAKILEDLQELNSHSYAESEPEMEM